MNKIKLSIKTSKDKNLKYYIYRSTKKDEVCNGVENLQYINPVIIVDETLAEVNTVRIKEELILDTSYTMENNMARYILSHEAVKNDKSNLPTTITINFHNPDEFVDYENVIFDLSFDSLGAIKQVVVTNKDTTCTTYFNKDDISKLITIDDENIYISNKLSANNYNITCDYYIEVIEVEDYVSKSTAGIRYLGPNAHGLNSPSIIATESSYKDLDYFNIPYLKLEINNDFSGLIYYYVIVAIDLSLNVSNVSKIIVERLNQSSENIKYTLQVSKDYSYKEALNANWVDTLTSLTSTNLIEIGKPSTEAFKDFAAIVNDGIPIFKESDIVVNTSYVNSDNKLVIRFPNIWYESIFDCNLRKSKAYRIIAVMDTDISEPSEVIYKREYENIPIEKLVVIKRNASKDENPAVPSNIGQIDTEIIKTYLRKDGLYYIQTDYDECPYNVMYSDSKVIIMSNQSTFNMMEIDTANCTSNEKYNYTFYLFDSYGNQSKPISVLVNL